MRDLGLPDDHERVGEVEAEEDDPTGRGRDVCPREEGGQEEAEADGGDGVGQHEDEDQGGTGEGEYFPVLKICQLFSFFNKGHSHQCDQMAN